MPVRNPDGRDAPPGGVRTSAWAFDHNRDFGTQNQVENGTFLPLLKRYPGLFFIDAHQQSTGYFFPPNEDPVHHEVSDFSLDFIQNRIGPALQQKFNDQSSRTATTTPTTSSSRSTATPCRRCSAAPPA